MEFRVLGPLEVHARTGAVHLGGARRRSLLAILVLNANETVATERLVDELWGERPPETAVKTVQVYVSQLRKELGADTIVTRPSGYALEVDPDSIDLHRFERLAEEGRVALAAGDAVGASERLREGLALWRGAPLSDLAYEPFVQAEAARLEELRLAALEDRIEADLETGRAPELVGELRGLAARYPLRERLCEGLMLALYRSGRQAEALDTYRAMRTGLVDELGIEPGRQLHELERAILSHDPALEGPTTRAPLKANAPPAGEVGEDVARSTPFVGREPELAELDAGLREAFAGRGAVFMVGGEPGIGKTRLGDELVSRARERGASALWGRCWEAGGAPAYWPWVQAIRTYTRESDPDQLRAQLGPDASDVVQIVPELGQLLPGPGKSVSTDAAGARFRLFDSMASLLKDIARARPLVLVLDDLHAADEPSLLMLRFMAANVADSPILIMGTYRDTDLDPERPLGVTLAELAREHATRRLSLGGLSVSEVARFIGLVTGTPPSERVMSAVHEQTDGNPLFVGEVVRLLDSEDGDRRRSLSVAVIPQSIREVIAHRLRGLSHECREVFTVAAVLGREFALAPLERASGRSAEELLEVLEPVVAGRLAAPVPGARERFRFSHALVREVLYESLPPARRARLHRQVAEALEDTYQTDPAPHLAELAHHFSEASPGGGDATAMDYARRAGDRAAELAAHEEAARLYRMALVGLGSAGDAGTRSELLLRLGEVQSRAGDMTAAQSTFLEAADLARRLGRPQELALAALGYGGRFVWARAAGDRLIVPLIREALATLGEEDSALRARLLARLAGALRDEPAPERRDRLSQQAARMARRLGDSATLTWTLDARHLAIWGPDTAHERISLADEMLTLAEESGELEPELLAHDYRLYGFLELGDLIGVETELQATLRLAEAIKQPAYWWKVRAVEALLALLQGRFEAAQRSMEQAAELGQALQSAAGATTHRLQLFGLQWAQGRLEEAEDGIRRAAAESPTYVIWRCVAATIACELGRRAEACDDFVRLAEDDFAVLHRDDEWLVGMSLLASVCAFLGDVARARILYEALLPYADRIAFGPPEFSTGSVSRNLGILASTLSLWDEAGEHFARAVEVNERMRARPWSAHTRHDWARMLLARARPGDRERALALADESIGAYRELGMDAWADRAEALKHSSEATSV